MSDEIQSVPRMDPPERVADPSDIRIDPNEEITDEKKAILLNQWKRKVEQELIDYSAGKEVINQAFRKQKERFDKILSAKVKKMKKYDTVMSSRKKVLIDIVTEIDKLIRPKI